MTEADILSVEGLSLEVRRRDGAVGSIVAEASLRVGRGEIVGLIGESGSGKTMTAKALIGLLPERVKVAAGSAMFGGRDLLSASPRALRAIRGAEIAVIPQDALHALNPVIRVGAQIGEPIEVHDPARPAAKIRQRVRDLLAQVGIERPAERARLYPHEFSGGMQQRAVTAMALAMSPRLIIADEPTTALDVTIQAQVLDLLRELRRATGTSFLFISHDLGLVSSFCDRIYVMYAGVIVERGPAASIFAAPRHPYTRALIGSAPRLGANPDWLVSIPGQIPSPFAHDGGCRFRSRCPLAEARCAESPPDVDHGGGHASLCWAA